MDTKHVLFTVLLLVLCLHYSNGLHNISITFNPREIIEMKEGHQQMVHFNISQHSTGGILKISSSNEHIARIAENQSISIDEPVTYPFAGSFSVEGVRLGRVQLTFEFNSSVIIKDYRVSVVRVPRTVDLVFRYCVIVFNVLLTLGFGTQLEWDKVVQIIKKPVNPCIGLVGQYIIMPLVSIKWAAPIVKRSQALLLKGQIHYHDDLGSKCAYSCHLSNKTTCKFVLLTTPKIWLMKVSEKLA